MTQQQINNKIDDLNFWLNNNYGHPLYPQKQAEKKKLETELMVQQKQTVIHKPKVKKAWKTRSKN